MSIDVQQLRKEYGSQVAVNDVSFLAQRGSITGFLGPNGAGKSTTMKMITGYLQPDGGKVLVDGVSVTAEPLRTKRMIGYLPESNALYYDMYIREYLEFTGRLYQVTPLRQRIAGVIEQVGLQPEAHKKIGQLSKGYKQRVGLAAAILHQPQVLILDEPTSGLDPNQIVDIRQVIKDLSADKTVLLSTHIMQEVEAICDHVIIINKGTIVANDSLQNLSGAGSSQATITVRFGEALESEWFLRLPSITAAEKYDGLQWKLKVTHAGQAKKELLQLALDHNLNLQQLREGGSLETIFRELTTTTSTMAD